MKGFTTKELETVLKFTNHLADKSRGASFADARTTDESLAEAEAEARAYAKARNAGGGKRARSDYGATEAERNITADVKKWLARQRKRHHKV
jgi:DNA polymerase/3'-5' exonuclease PolX